MTLNHTELGEIDMNQVVINDSFSGKWLWFQRPVQILQANRITEVLPVLQQVQDKVDSEQFWAAGFISYEAAPAFDTALKVRSIQEFPLAWFGLFDPPEPIDLPSSAPQEIALQGWQPSVSREQYDAAIQQIKDQIALGNTYQVNYTMRLNTPFQGDAWELFLRLSQAQQAQYAAFVDTGQFALCSASPELFFILDGEKLVSKPMKGTAARGLTLTQDKEQAKWLQNSEKNRAENVMIVDMIRNDMGRVARTGSVHVPNLFEVERYPTVWQMTSTVKSETSASFVEIMAALFPCASITGAPKPRTMQIISELETTPRRVYTGCIGVYAPQRKAQFNVAIRTVLVDRSNNQAEYGVGGGIVWDSTSNDEYNECMVKARVLTELQPTFEILESILWSSQEGFYLLEQHFQRLQESANYFGFPCDLQLARRQLDALAEGLPPLAHKVRLLLSKSGNFTCNAAAIDLAQNSNPVHLGLAVQPVSSKDVFLYHKTTWRKVYDAELSASPGYDDILLWNERDELTETCLGNIVVQIGGNLFTPPVECGLLPGIFRENLITQGIVHERVIRRDEVTGCERVFVVNSVRGMREADL